MTECDFNLIWTGWKTELRAIRYLSTRRNIKFFHLGMNNIVHAMKMEDP